VAGTSGRTSGRWPTRRALAASWAIRAAWPGRRKLSRPRNAAGCEPWPASCSRAQTRHDARSSPGAGAHVRQDRGPGPGHDVGDPRGAVRRGLRLGHPRSFAAAAGQRPGHTGVRGERRQRPDDLAPLLLSARRPDPARAGEDLPRLRSRVGCSTSPGGLSRAPTRRAAPTRRMPRSAIQMATGGCSRRSRRGFRAGSGTTDPGVPRRTAHPAPRICSRRMSAWPQCWANSRRACRYTQRRGSGPK